MSPFLSSTGFPPALKQALDALSLGVARSDLADRSNTISGSYQRRQNSSQALLTSQDALAYALARMPATYAAACRALLHLVQAAPSLAPQTMLDLGCGPGTASFAGQTVFESIARFSLIDRNGPFLDLAQQIANTVLPEGSLDIIRHDIGNRPSNGYHESDLVMVSYVLAELSPSSQEGLITDAWAATRQALVLIEPGTPDGFQRLGAARDTLIRSGGFVAAPCTHEAACPMHGENWCRFLERVQRSRDHRFLKSADRSYEDEPFAYLAVTRQKPEQRASGRIVGKTALTKFEVALPVCTEEGLSSQRVAKRDKEKFKQFKSLEWGDAVLNPIQEDKAKA